MSCAEGCVQFAYHGRGPGGGPVQAIIESFCDEEMGGRVYACMVGSAPSAPEVVHFLREALGAPITESFGSTETGDNLLGHCAAPAQLPAASCPSAC